MSGSVLLSPDLPIWMLSALPASFRDVFFYWGDIGGTGGRRLVTHEFPLRDDPYTEDLGRMPRRFKVKAFVIGDDFVDQKAALISAIEDYDDAAVLVHPNEGPITCRAGVLAYQETIEHGGACFFDLEFVRDGPQPSPASATDPASALLAGINSLLPIIGGAYAVVQLAEVAGLLASVVTALLALPTATITGLAGAIAAIDDVPSDPVATAAAVQAVTTGMAANVIAAALLPTLPDDPVAGDAFVIPGPTDLSGGLAGLAAWGSTFAAPIGAGTFVAPEAAQQAAVVALIQGYAVAATVQVYAAITWPTVQAATTARAQVLALIDGQAQAAAEAAQDQLYLAWLGLLPLTISMMIAQAQNLPSLVSYAVPDALPSVVLGQMFYQDASQAPTLEALNDVPDPLFMAPVGLALSPGSIPNVGTAPIALLG